RAPRLAERSPVRQASDGLAVNHKRFETLARRVWRFLWRAQPYGLTHAFVWLTAAEIGAGLGIGEQHVQKRLDDLTRLELVYIAALHEGTTPQYLPKGDFR